MRTASRLNSALCVAAISGLLDGEYCSQKTGTKPGQVHTDLSDASQTWLNDVARLMNGRPRKTLGWKTPAEAMAEEIKAFSSTVALDV